MKAKAAQAVPVKKFPVQMKIQTYFPDRFITAGEKTAVIFAVI